MVIIIIVLFIIIVIIIIIVIEINAKLISSCNAFPSVCTVQHHNAIAFRGIFPDDCETWDEA